MRIVGTLLLSVALGGSACAQSRGMLAGIDHIPLAVRNLDLASRDFEQFGFSIKPGRPHTTGIGNRHIKFPDGSGLELITVTAATDELAAAYLRHLQAGDGPAYLSFHVRDPAVLASALVEAGIGFDQAAGLTTFKDPGLGFVFITNDNRSPTDRPEHFAHSNGAYAMGEVWIACRDATPLKRLLLALGARFGSGTVRVPEPTEGETFELQNGRVVIVGSRHQLVPGRSVIGVVMSVRPPAARPPTDPPTGRSGLTDSGVPWSKGLVAPDNAHGLWLAFREAQ